MFVLCALVRLTSKGPALFWSERTGYKGTPFMMPKLRTMTQESKVMSRESAKASDISFTPIGRALRKTSLDELPQLWCVFKGEMSLIGPRPLLVNDRAASQRRARPEIYTVKPGITGLAQINGRNFISMRNKVRYDAFYAERVCLFLDAKILYRTVGTVFNFKLVQ
jgi:O-antigen biosynthesis protein WbqP